MALITASWSLDVILILTALVTAVYIYVTRRFNHWKKRGVTELQPTPFFGNFADCMFLKKSPGFLLKDFYDQAKGQPYLGFFILDKPVLLIRDRELVKNVLVKDFNYFADRHSAANPKDRIGYASLFFLTNPAWKTLRAKLTPFFSSGKLKKMYELMLDCSNNLDTHFESLELVGKGKELDLKDVAVKFSTDMIGCTAFGYNVNSLNNPDIDFLKYGKKIFEFDHIRGLEFFVVFFYPSLIRFTNTKIFGKANDYLRNVFWETINKRTKSGVKRHDLIDILIELKKSHGNQDINGFKFDGDDLVAQATTFFSGGFETSSTTISFTLYELAIHPEIQNRVRKEILDALKKSDGKITYDMTMSLPYLDMVISETLRKYPPLPFLDRLATNTYKVPDFDLVIEKNTPIYISMLGMHYDPEYFPDPDKFDPERFNEENKRNILSGTYFPFGEGPHACIATRLGLLQTKLGLIKMLTNHEVAPSEKTLIPMIIDPKAGTTTPLGGKMYLNIRKINNNTKQNLVK